MTVVSTPVKGFSGVVAGVRFVDGRGETESPSALAYFRRRGYTVGEPSEPVESAPQPRAAAPFDPSKHSVDEVNAYLSTADHAERERVLQEEAQEKSRVRILTGPYADLSK